MLECLHMKVIDLNIGNLLLRHLDDLEVGVIFSTTSNTYSTPRCKRDVEQVVMVSFFLSGLTGPLDSHSRGWLSFFERHNGPFHQLIALHWADIVVAMTLHKANLPGVNLVALNCSPLGTT